MKITESKPKELTPVQAEVAVKINKIIERAKAQPKKEKSLPLHLIHPYSINKEALRKIQEKLPELLKERQRIESEISALKDQESVLIPFLKSIEENF